MADRRGRSDPAAWELWSQVQTSQRCFLISEQSPQTFRVGLRGEIDLSRREELRTLIGWYARSGSSDVVVDLSEVTFFDSTGLAALVDLQRESRLRGGRLWLRQVPPLVDKLIRLTSLESVLVAEPAQQDGTGGA